MILKIHTSSESSHKTVKRKQQMAHYVTRLVGATVQYTTGLPGANAYVNSNIWAEKVWIHAL